MSFLTVGSSNLRPIKRLRSVRECGHWCHVLFGEDVLDVEDGVRGVHGGLVLGRLADEALLGGEGNEGWGGEASLLVGDCVRCG